ncbi:CapA family protein [Bacillus sp. USDA818B3_A]|uniref:CapA family protein n=1 Tax=Bacillus sp. USDA818B3_A TaxID=2698834 RepID=UPI00136E08E0|nr:CapA family protein [Bacillus sp. USDA818B3_A]
MVKKTFVLILFLVLFGGITLPVQAQEYTQQTNLYRTNEQSSIDTSSFYFDFYGKKIFGRFFKDSVRKPISTFYSQAVTIQKKLSGTLFNLPNQTSSSTNEKPIRLSFAGDAMMDWSVKETIKQKGPDYPFVQIKEELQSSDLSVVNLETSITSGGTKQGKQYTFRSDPIALTGLKNAGFQLVSLANNHSLDYGQTGFTDTLANLHQYQLDYVGGGHNREEAYKAGTYSLNGKTVKILAFSKVLPDYSWVATDSKPGLANGYDLNLIEKTIQIEKADADFLFVFIHWGVEKNRTPEPFQREWARGIIDAGADGVIGSHPHVLQGFEYYKNKPIAYSLGNFLFPDYIKGNAAQTGILHLDLDENHIKMTFVPFLISQDQIVSQSEQEKSVIWKELQGLSYGGLTILNGEIVEQTTLAETN